MGVLAKSSLILVFVLTLIPRCAFAASPVLSYNDMGILWGPQLIDAPNELNGVVVSANSNLNAALVALGHDVLDSKLTHDVKAKLSNESTGGAFYSFAQLFESAYPVGGPQNFPSWGYTPGSTTTSMWGAFSTWVTVLGEGNVWWAEYTDSQFASAGEDLEAVLNGGNAGGSGGGSGNNVTINGKEFILFDTQDVPEGFEQRERTYAGAAVSVTYLNWITDRLSSLGYDSTAKFWIAICDLSTGVVYPHAYVTVAAVGNMPNFGTTYVNPSYSWTAWEEPSRYSFFGQWQNNINSGDTYVVDGKKYIKVDIASGTNGFGSYVGVTDACRPVYSYYFGDFEGNGSGGGSDVPPENNWPEPDNPVTPDPPSPDPPSPVGPTAPTLPKPMNPTQPTNVTVTVATPVDDILDAINKVIQELENHCVHLQNKMVECSKYIGEYLGQVRDSILDAFDTNADFNASLHDDLMNYLEELFGWMRENLNYDLTVTNSGKDDDIIDLLRLIFIQDGTGDINLRPVDITQDYDGFGFWTHLLVGETLPDLTDTNLSPVTSAFDNLDDKFPFSVPSDILRIFQSLDKPAQTPVLTFTMPAVGGIPSYSYVVDLSPYDSAMQTVRTIELVGFVVFLLVWARRSLMTEAVGADD